MRNKSLIVCLLAVSSILLTGCQNQPKEEDKIYTPKGPFSYEMEKYENNKYGYTIDLPKSWGAIWPYAGNFTDNLSDDLETIGPLVPFSYGISPNLDVEVFTNDNSARKANQKWIDFYKELRLEKNEKYQETPIEINKYPATDIELLNNNGAYQRSCWLLENNNKLYTFCFHKENHIALDIVRSIQLK